MGHIEIDLPTWFTTGVLVLLGIYCIIDCVDRIVKYRNGRLKRDLAYEKEIEQLLVTISDKSEDNMKLLSDIMSLKREVLRRRIFHTEMLRKLSLYRNILITNTDHKEGIRKALEEIRRFSRELILNNEEEIYITVESLVDEYDELKSKEFQHGQR